MSFNSTNLTLSSDGLPWNTVNMGWKYTTSDTLSTVEGFNYFNSAGLTSLRSGDMIAVEASNGDRLYTVSLSGSLGSPIVSTDNFVDFSSLPNNWV